MEGTAFIPEYEVLNAIKVALNYIRSEYSDHIDPTNSYLRKLLANRGIGRYDAVTQAEKIFLADIDDPRYLEAHLMFNMEKAPAPTIHIMLPSDQIQSGANAIGMDVGSKYEEDYLDDSDEDPSPDSYSDIFTRRFQTTFSIVITSDNSNEVVLVYHVIRSILIAMTKHLSLRGLENLSLGGQDLNINSSLIPNNLFFRSITMNFQYETSTPDVNSSQIFKSLTADGKPIA